MRAAAGGSWVNISRVVCVSTILKSLLYIYPLSLQVRPETLNPKS